MKRISTSQRYQEQQQQPINFAPSNLMILDSAAEDSISKKEKQENRNKKGRILIIDDEVDSTYALKLVLEQDGFISVDIYNDPIILLQKFKSSVYSLLITDVAMPGMNGFELYKHIKAVDANIRVLFMTASNVNYEALNELFQFDRAEGSYEDKEAKIRNIHEERLSIIRKPVEIKDFVQRVCNELQIAITQPREINSIFPDVAKLNML